jgi:hypothetical protein
MPGSRHLDHRGASDGHHANVVVPAEGSDRAFGSIEEAEEPATRPCLGIAFRPASSDLSFDHDPDPHEVRIPGGTRSQACVRGR